MADLQDIILSYDDMARGWLLPGQGILSSNSALVLALVTGNVLDFSVNYKGQVFTFPTRLLRTFLDSPFNFLPYNSSLIISKSFDYLEVGQSAPLKSVMYHSNGNSSNVTCELSSTNDDVLQIEDDMLVAVSPGVANVIASYEDQMTSMPVIVVQQGDKLFKQGHYTNSGTRWN